MPRREAQRALRSGGRDFTHLHNHTEFSTLDGLAKIQEYVEVAKRWGMSALGIMDHGVICGHPEFYKACLAADIQPLLGEEFYFLDDPSYKPPKGSQEEKQDRSHFGVIAKGERGHRVLSELSTLAHRRFAEYKTGKPVLGRADIEALGDDAKHLVVLSGCAASLISRAIMSGNMAEARERVLWWREHCPNFYIELMHHDTDFDLQLNAGLVELAQRYSIPWVITNDPHYAIPEDHEHHDTLLAIQTAADVDDPDRFRFDGSGYHLRSRDELRRLFRRHYGDEVWRPGAAETLRIARKCQVRIPAWETKSWRFPSYARANGDANGLLRKLALRGLRRSPDRERPGHMLSERPEYMERLKYELKTFKEVGIADFLLITRWCIRAALKGGQHPELGPIWVGPGRGSVCGSLVGYCIGLHKIDPILYDLRFDRFLNPARPKMPDIDTDFAQSRRDEMFEVVKEEYGTENVLKVAAYAHMHAKRAFQSLAKAHGLSFPDRIRISKELSDDPEDSYALPDEVTLRFPEIAAKLERLSGTKCGYQNHAAGIVIADPTTKIREVMPEMWIAGSKRWVGQYDLHAVENMGLLKQDFLGLRTGDTIVEAVRIIHETTGELLDPDSWWPDHEENDDVVYAMLAEGKTAGVFQMEGPTNQRGIQAIAPTCFEDIVSCTALYRTGAISAGFPAIFLRNRQGRIRDIAYVHPGLQPFLESTWGVVLYQEQVMDIAEHLAGFSGALIADIVDAIKHKSGPAMQVMKPKFIQGCTQVSGMSQTTAKEIWRMIEGYSGYGYNRSHAVAYTFTTYQTARLKALWPRQFMTAMLRTVDTGTKEGKEKRDRYRREAIEVGCKIAPPCINRSDARPILEADQQTLRLGLTDFRGVGEAAALKAILGRSEGLYGSVEAVSEAVRNSGTLNVLATGGALEELGVPGDRAAQEDLLEWQFKDPMRRYRRDYGNDVVLPDDGGSEDEEYVCILGRIYKITRATTKAGKPYCTWKIRYSPTKSYDVRLWAETEKLWSLKEGSVVMVSGKWEGRWNNVSCGKPNAIRVIKAVRG